MVIVSSSSKAAKLSAAERATASMSLSCAPPQSPRLARIARPMAAEEMTYDGEEDGERLSLGLGLGVAVTAFTRSAKSGLS